ncbi:MAG: ROK family protein, partial [Firmicutes bacterium]|nr:ROK family protein [Bacillota bacterium]
MGGLRVGIDIGGSEAKIGLVASSGEILARGKVPTREAETAADLVNHICDAVSDLLAHAGGRPLVGIGVGVPGYVTPEGLPEFTNVPVLNGYPIARRLSEVFGVPAGIDNDANVAVLAEYRHGGGHGARRLMLVTGGTGIGVAVILDGALVKFTGGSTGSIGHIIVNPYSEDRCAAGCRGCLETLATAPALERRAERAAVAHPESLLAER